MHTCVQGELEGLYAGIFLAMGSLISWCGIVNNAIFAAIVRPQSRSTIYAMDRCIEGQT